ncbi:MAG TPA: glycosyltransferase family 4 protein [Gemmatimonadota bacterium]|jgi:glycogen(starch) synthase|nr:glycosyltransferase family 4 protein [Gemmatimonadota bacterium]
MNRPSSPRVLFWSEYYWPYIGGPEVMATRLLPALRDRGFRFTVLTSQHQLDLPPEDEVDGIPILRIPFRAPVEQGDMETFGRVVHRIEEIKRSGMPDLVHLLGLGTAALYQMKTARTFPAPLLVTLQNRLLTDGGAAGDTLQSRVLGAADGVVACSAAIREEVARRVPTASSRCVVIPNSIETPDRPPTPLPFQPPRLLCLGRLVPVKGFDLALTALAAIHDQIPDLCLTVAGDGPTRAGLERMAAEAGLESVVRFTGWVRPGDIPDLINEATIVLLPSREREGLPVVAVQAALMGRPMIATPVGGLPEIVVHGVTGLIVEEEDPRALAKAITALLDRPHTARAMGERARLHALDRFGWEAHVDAYEHTYRRLIAGRSP